MERCPDMSQTDCTALADLSEGSAGKAIELADEGGLDYFRVLMSLFSKPNTLPLAKIHGLADQLARKDAKSAYAVFRELLGWWLTRLIRISATGTMPPAIMPDEVTALQACMGLAPTGKWIEIRDKVLELFSKTDAPSNLDRKQVIVSAFLTLETMLQQR